MSNVIQIEDIQKEKWIVGEAICMKCGFIWAVVAPEDVCEMFECPECGLMYGHFRYPYGLDVGEEVYQCNCGSQIFEIGVDYFICKVCGTKHLKEEVW